MREILFRGKRRDLAHEQLPQKYPERECEFVYGTGIYDDGVNLWLILKNSENKPFSQLKNIIVDPKTVGQFTELRDNKRTAEFPEGQRIFEGDILKVDHYPAPFLVTVDIFHGHRFMIGKDQLCRADAINGEVIGNIHQNAELLEAVGNE